MDPATVTVQLEPADIRKFSKIANRKTGSRWKTPLLFIAAGVLFTFSYLADPSRQSFWSSAWPVLSGVLIMVVSIVILYWLRMRRRTTFENYSPGIFSPNTYTALDEGLYCQNDRGETLHYWKIVLRLIETEEYILIMIARRNGHVLPKRCFPTREAAAVFLNQVRMQLEKHAPTALAGESTK
jgi:hypothetical protein